ncbi:MAG: hypothetical protein ABIH86_05680 [Planctomycetota bacterium]
MGTIRIIWGSDARSSRLMKKKDGTSLGERPMFLGLTTLAMIFGAVAYGFYLVRSYTQSRRSAELPPASDGADSLSGWNPVVKGPVKPKDIDSPEIASLSLYPRAQDGEVSGLREIINLINSAEHHIVGCLPNAEIAPIVDALAKASDRGVFVRVLSRATGHPALTETDQPLPPMFFAVDGVCAAVCSEPLLCPQPESSDRRVVVATLVSPTLVRKLEALVGNMTARTGVLSVPAPGRNNGRDSIFGESVYEKDGPTFIALSVSKPGETDGVLLDAMASAEQSLTVFGAMATGGKEKGFIDAMASRGIKTTVYPTDGGRDAGGRSARLLITALPATIAFRAVGDPSGPTISIAIYGHPLSGWIESGYRQ